MEKREMGGRGAINWCMENGGSYLTSGSWRTNRIRATKTVQREGKEKREKYAKGRSPGKRSSGAETSAYTDITKKADEGNRTRRRAQVTPVRDLYWLSPSKMGTRGGKSSRSPG